MACRIYLDGDVDSEDAHSVVPQVLTTLVMLASDVKVLAACAPTGASWLGNPENEL